MSTEIILKEILAELKEHKTILNQHTAELIEIKTIIKELKH